MTTAPMSVTGQPSTRTLEWLAGTDLLTAATGNTTDQLASLGPIASVIDAVSEGAAPGSDVQDRPAVLTEPLNQLVLDTHAHLEETGHEVPVLNGPLQGLTNLGETVGLGHLGTSGNVATDTVSAVLGGDVGAATGILVDAGHVEPPRVSWRLQLLRGWSHDEANSPVFP